MFSENNIQEKYNRIERVVNKQIDRLRSLSKEPGDSCFNKAGIISAALQRLKLVVLLKTGKKLTPGTYNYIAAGQLNMREVEDMDLSSIEKMMAIRISEWEPATEHYTHCGQEFNGNSEGYQSMVSLNQALSIGRNNWFNFPMGTWGTLFGQAATAIREVQEELSIKLT